MSIDIRRLLKPYCVSPGRDLYEITDEEFTTLEALLAAEPPPTEACICEIDKHDFNCPVHNDHAPESRKHHE
jgi:hypothetical protein